MPQNVAGYLYNLTMKDGTYRKTETGLEQVETNFGYWVASKEITPDELKVGEFLGVWTDPETGKVCYDKTFFLQDLNAALILCSEWNQKAIWDNKNSVAIPKMS